MNRTVVLTYGQLFEFSPCYKDQPSVARCTALGADTRVYSTGRLERVIGRTREIYVVCTKPALESHDDWWSSQLPREHIFLALSRQQIVDHDLISDATTQTLYPWLCLCEQLGHDASGDVETVEDIQEFLMEKTDITFGDAIRPWSYANPPKSP